MIHSETRSDRCLPGGAACLALAQLTGCQLAVCLLAVCLLTGCVLDDPIGAEARGEGRSAGVDRSMEGLSVKQGPDGEEQLSIDRSIDFSERSEVDEMLRPDRDR